MTLALLALLACGSGKVSAQTETETPATQQVQLAPLPNTDQFNQLVDFRVRPSGESLDAMVQALARSVGLSAVTQGISADAVVNYDFAEPKPFREIWDIVLTLNGLEYVLRGNNIVVVGPPAVLESLQPQEQAAEPRVAVTYPVNSPPSQLQALLESQFPAGSGVTITAFDDLRLMSVRGTSAQQAKVQDLLERFDKSRQTAVRRVYNLSFAKARGLAPVILGALSSNNAGDFSESRTVPDLCDPQQIPTSESSTDVSAGEPSSTQTDDTTQADQPILSIFPDDRTNQLIVTAPEPTQDEIVSLLEQLDVPESQINVQVRIQEISSDVSERLGINLTSAVGNFATTLFGADANDGLSFIFDGQKAVSAFNLGAVLDAYDRQGLSRRVDDSNLTVLNNGLASLRSGGNINISLPSAGGEANLIRTIAYGVLVGLNPQVTNSGDVILDVCARVDTPLTEITDANLQNISTRRVGSVVTLSPGQTVVLGGLLQNQLTETKRSVPGLSDIPVVGDIFSTNSSSETQSELLVIVTANVLE